MLRRRRVAVALFLLLAATATLALAAPAAGAAWAAQPGSGAIEGQIVPRGGATALGGRPALRPSGTAAAARVERTATAGEDGGFRLEGGPRSEGAIYRLRGT